MCVHVEYFVGHIFLKGLQLAPSKLSSIPQSAMSRRSTKFQGFLAFLPQLGKGIEVAVQMQQTKICQLRVLTRGRLCWLNPYGGAQMCDVVFLEEPNLKINALPYWASINDKIVYYAVVIADDEFHTMPFWLLDPWLTAWQRVETAFRRKRKLMCDESNA